MGKPRILKGSDRIRLLEELHRRYASSNTLLPRLVYLRKKYSWLLVVNGAKILKRLIDIIASVILLVALSPLFLLVAILIKATDGGSVLYVANRVGKWGKEIRFPKFRTMVIDAAQQQEALQAYNERPGGPVFKMKHDPRVTWIGRILRRTSFDELPQLWCVLKGDMSLVGPRPPIPNEVAGYTLDERRRLDITPGLTCIWQVSGRAELDFTKQVRLDVQYIESQSIWLDFKLLLKTIPAIILGRGAY